MVEMHHHKLSPTICDYEQLISIDYTYNQLKLIVHKYNHFEINEAS